MPSSTQYSNNKNSYCRTHLSILNKRFISINASVKYCLSFLFLDVDLYKNSFLYFVINQCLEHFIFFLSVWHLAH